MIRTAFARDVCPRKICTRDFATPNSLARNRINAAFALPSSGAARRSILIVPSAIVPLTPVRFAPGCTRTVKVTSPFDVNCAWISSNT